MGNQRNDQEAGNRLRYSPNYDFQVPRFSFLYYLKIIFPQNIVLTVMVF